MVSQDTLGKIFSIAFFWTISKLWFLFTLDISYGSQCDNNKQQQWNISLHLPCCSLSLSFSSSLHSKLDALLLLPVLLLTLRWLALTTVKRSGKKGQKSKNSKLRLGKYNGPNRKRSKIWRKNHRWSKSIFRLHAFIIRKPIFSLIKSILKYL